MALYWTSVLLRALLLPKRLRDAGFDIESGLAGIPTAFSATYGKGAPVIATLGEFDAPEPEMHPSPGHSFRGKGRDQPPL